MHRQQGIGVMAKIPREIWRFCVDQIKYYPLTEIAYVKAKADIQASYIDSGMSGPPDPTGVHVHSGQGPQGLSQGGGA